MSGDPEQEYLADGITEDIITALARLRWLFVIARNSTFTYKGKAVDVRQVARELGVRYVLEGSVRIAGRAHPRHRPAHRRRDRQAHLGRASTTASCSDIFAVQDEITERVVAAVEPHLYAEEGFRAAAKPPGQHRRLGPRGARHRAAQQVRSRAERGGAGPPAAGDRASSRATRAPMPFWAGRSGGRRYATGCRTREEGYRQAAAHAQDASPLDPTDPWARMVFGLCLSTAGQHERALGELQAALDLNPSFALGHMAFGWALLRAGHFDEAIAETGWALRMSPVDSFAGFYTSIHGLALLGARRFEEALPFLRASVAAFAEYSGPLQLADQLLRPSRPDRGSAGIHRRAQQDRPAAPAQRAAREPGQFRALRRVHRGTREGRRAGVTGGRRPPVGPGACATTSAVPGLDAPPSEGARHRGIESAQRPARWAVGASMAPSLSSIAGSTQALDPLDLRAAREPAAARQQGRKASESSGRFGKAPAIAAESGARQGCVVLDGRDTTRSRKTSHNRIVLSALLATPLIAAAVTASAQTTNPELNRILGMAQGEISRSQALIADIQSKEQRLRYLCYNGTQQACAALDDMLVDPNLDASGLPVEPPAGAYLAFVPTASSRPTPADKCPSAFERCFMIHLRIG